MPGWTTVWDWQQKYPEFAEDFARARSLGFDAIAEEMFYIADTPCVGEEIELDADGNITKIKRGDMLGHRRLQVDTRARLLAKWDRKRYGDHTQTEISGPYGARSLPGRNGRAARVAHLLVLAKQRERESDANDSE